MQPGNVPSAKVLTTALCTVLPITVAHLMKACATAWPTASIIMFSCYTSVNGWKDGRLNFLITSPDLLMLYDLRHSRLNFSTSSSYSFFCSSLSLSSGTGIRFFSLTADLSVSSTMLKLSCPTGRAKRCVDAKINTLESEGKCSPSHGKSTKRASQFDLKSTREKINSNSRVYRLGFRISLR